MDGWYILEAAGQGVEINWYSDKALSEKTRCWDWFDEEPEVSQMETFLQEHIDKRYDVAIYFWTGLAIIIRHYFNRPIPKLLDDRFCCWELAAEFCAEMGKPVVSKYDVIILPELIRVFRNKESRDVSQSV